MTAIRLCLAPAALLMLAGICCGQHRPLLDPGHHLESVPNAGDYPAPRLEAYHAEVHETELNVGPLHGGHAGEWDSHQMHVESDVEACEACNCEEKHCEGVCTDPGRPKKPKHDKPGDVNRGDCPPLRYKIPDCKRAGNPHCVAKWAKCSVSDKYSSWFVGGGAAFFRGRCRHPSEGTWGLDYDGLFGHVNNWLTYTRGLKGHGRKQGGEGAYETDGEPKVVSRGKEILHLGH